MVAIAEFIFMRNRIDHAVQAVNIRSNPNRLALNARINFRNCLDRRIHALCVLVNFLHEISEGLNSELHPLAEISVRKISQLQIFLGIETSLFLESCHGVVVEACPRTFPAIEVRHPIGDVHIDSINFRARYLPHAFHVNLAPGRSIRTDPHIFIAFADPESAAASKDRRFSRNLPLQPIRMLLGQRVRSLFRVCRNALGSSDVNKSVVPGNSGLVCRTGEIMNTAIETSVEIGDKRLAGAQEWRRRNRRRIWFRNISNHNFYFRDTSLSSTKVPLPVFGEHSVVLAVSGKAVTLARLANSGGRGHRNV